MSVQRIVIIGAGGHGSELHSYIQDLQAKGEEIELIGFIDDNRPIGDWNSSRILGPLSVLHTLPSAQLENLLFITAVGNNSVRQRLVEQLSTTSPSPVPWTLRHPSALVGQNVEIGAGSCLAPGVIITTKARVGRHCILNVNVSLSHDSTVGDFSNLNPGAVVAGNVDIGAGAFIGAGATLIDRVKIGEWSVIGAGAVVIDDIPPHTTAVGVPARVIKHHD